MESTASVGAHGWKMKMRSETAMGITYGKRGWSGAGTTVEPLGTQGQWTTQGTQLSRQPWRVPQVASGQVTQAT